MTNAYICIVAVAPMRAEAAHRSEMVSQLLLGELAEELQASGDFVQVRARYDGYEGWVQRSQLAVVEVGPHDQSAVVLAAGQQPLLVDGVAVPAGPGSELFFKAVDRQLLNRQGLQAGVHQLVYPADWQLLESMAPAAAEVAVAAAHGYLGVPYLWGGKSRAGIDCSGLVQMAFKQAGMFVPRDAWQQAEGGDVVAFLAEARPGDLAFFDNEEGRITHVGMLLGPQRILHASGVVRIDPIDHAGIVHAQTGKRTHQLRVIKRFF